MINPVSELKKMWAKDKGKPVMVNSDWCDDWKAKHPGNCAGCPQHDNCRDFTALVGEISQNLLRGGPQ